MHVFCGLNLLLLLVSVSVSNGHRRRKRCRKEGQTCVERGTRPFGLNRRSYCCRGMDCCEDSCVVPACKGSTGGATVDISLFPYQGSLQQMVDGEYAHIAAAVLFSNNKALVAASSVDGIPPGELRVVFGTDDLSDLSSAQLSNITSYSQFPSFNQVSLENNIAVIRLTSPMNTAVPNVGPIVLASGSNDYVDSTVEVSGFGLVAKCAASFGDALESVSATVIDNAACSTSLTNGGSSFSLQTGNICYTGAVCVGDIGGPIVVGQTLVGTLSKPVDDESLPSVATRISSFFGWIQAQ